MRQMLPKSSAGRWTLGLVAGFVLLNAVLALGQALTPQPSGKPGSSYATQAQGLAAWAELLRRGGHPVTRRREALGGARLDPASTAVVLDPRRIGRRDTAALRAFVRRGGRLVAGGPRPDWLARVVDAPPRWVARAPAIARRGGSDALPRGVERVRSAGRGGWSDAGGGAPALGSDPALLVDTAAGRGRALLLADSSPLHNRLLARDDNAALGLALAGAPRRPVVFVESVHEVGRSTGLAALPGHWKVALAGLVLAALLWLASRARRLGPPERPAPEPAPPRREHVDALAAALVRTRDRRTAAEPLRAAARGRVAARAGLAPDAPDGEIRAAALHLGLDERETAALLEPVTDDDDLLAVGGVLARTWEDGR